MMDPKINNNAGIMIGEVVFFAKSTKKSAVPSSDVMVPIDQANVKMINTMVMLLNPLTYRDIASLKENNFCCIPSIRPTKPSINAASKLHTPPSASPTAMTISCSGKPPVNRNIGGIKASKTMIGIIIFRFLSRSEEHTSELQSRFDLVCRLLLEKKNFKLHYNLNQLHNNLQQTH